MPAIHHTAICTADVEESLRFWRDGLGFEVLMDEVFDGDWPTLLHGPDRSLRSVFLGDPDHSAAGIIELVDLGGEPRLPARQDPPARGFLLVSLTTDVVAALERLRRLELGGPPRQIEAYGVAMAVVVDPDGTLVELIDDAATGELDTLTGGAAPS